MKPEAIPLPAGFSLDDMGLPDVDQVHVLEQECFPTPWSRDAIAHEVHNDRALTKVIRYKATVVGYLIGWHVVDEFHIGNLAAHPGYRNQGIASSLLAYLLGYLADLEYSLITLEVRESNQGARNLYAKYGFQPVALRRRYYGNNGEDAVIMVRDLTPKPISP